MEELKRHMKDIGRDVLVALLILGLILGSLYIYSGRWPPMVVVESSSMSHSDASSPQSQLGVIDTGDIVTVKSSGRNDIMTYVEGKAEGHKTYGQYGDVIVYRPYGKNDQTPIIHRPVVYLHYNSTSDSFDIPSLKELEYGEDWTSSQRERTTNLTGTITIHDYGYREATVQINLQRLLNRPDRFVNSGYITRGDNNNRYDQTSERICLSPIKQEWVEGKARGELPWFGILKLTVMGRAGDVPQNSWNYLILSLAVIAAIPFILDFGIQYYQDRKEDEEKESGEEDTGGLAVLRKKFDPILNGDGNEDDGEHMDLEGTEEE